MMETQTLDACREAILAAFPDLSGADFRFHDAGWDCVAVDADDRLIFKFPRREEARRKLEREAAMLAEARPRVSLAVPCLTLHGGPPPFSSHEKIPGDHLLPGDYNALPEAARRGLAETLARFYAELHALDTGRMADAGAGPIEPWESPESVRAKALPALPSDLRAVAEEIVAAFEALPPDPYGVVFGFYDGHGWNMAFDRARGRLNGVYDFADSGFGSLHQDFVYSNFTARDLTERIITAYEDITARPLDRRRIETLSAYQRLSEVAEFADGPDRGAGMVRAFAQWVSK